MKIVTGRALPSHEPKCNSPFSREGSDERWMADCVCGGAYALRVALSAETGGTAAAHV